MYSSLGLKVQMLNERDQDVALEVGVVKCPLPTYISDPSPFPSTLTQHDEKEIYEHFSNFYNDVFPEFLKAGKVVQFKVA